MAVTKIHPIKSTLKKALDYITNPAKTEGKLYVSSFGCAVETADIEFEKTRLRAMNKGNNLAHHLIQAFEPGEVTPEAAHEIGRQPEEEIAFLMPSVQIFLMGWLIGSNSGVLYRKNYMEVYSWAISLISMLRLCKALVRLWILFC